VRDPTLGILRAMTEDDHVRLNRSAWDEWSTEYEEPDR
jgi:hypothetical protein